MSFGLVAGWLALGLMSACVTGSRSKTTTALSFVPSTCDEHEAVGVLNAAIDSPEPGLRALGFVAWIKSGTPRGLKLIPRGVMDPSPYVQRALARDVPVAVGTAFLDRSAPDPLAVAWLGLAGERVQALSEEAPSAWLASAITGDVPALGLLLKAISEGDVPPDQAFFDVLTQVKLEGLGAALIDGLALAEPDLALSMAVAAMAQAHPDAVEMVAESLARADDPSAPFWVVEFVVTAGVVGADDWLEMLVSNAPEALALHAKLGLVALGKAPTDIVIAAMASSDRDTRAWAATVLAQAPVVLPLPRDHLLALQGSARSEAPRVKRAAVQALLRLAPVSDLPISQDKPGLKPDPVSIAIAAKCLAVSPGGATD